MIDELALNEHEKQLLSRLVPNIGTEVHLYAHNAVPVFKEILKARAENTNIITSHGITPEQILSDEKLGVVTDHFFYAAACMGHRHAMSKYGRTPPVQYEFAMTCGRRGPKRFAIGLTVRCFMESMPTTHFIKTEHIVTIKTK